MGRSLWWILIGAVSSMQAVVSDYLETPNDAFIWKMSSENTLELFIAWSERRASV